MRHYNDVLEQGLITEPNPTAERLAQFGKRH